MNPTRTAVLALALTAGLALTACTDDGGAAAAAPTATGGTTVELAKLRFEPEALRVPAGTEVTWVWTDGLAHNVVGEGFKSEVMRGGRFRHTFDEPGEVAYTCTLHPGMDGTIVVE